MSDTVFDPVRKKRVVLTPEEGVRQWLIKELSSNYGYPLSLMSCEFPIEANRIQYRGDLIVFSRDGNPVLLAECKAPHIKIDLKVFDQVVKYSLLLKVNYIIVTNGKDIYMGKYSNLTGRYQFLTTIPQYNELS